jgi:hypothetical protein
MTATREKIESYVFKFCNVDEAASTAVNIRIKCPVHQPDEHPSCDVDRDTGMYICRVCGAKGNLHTLRKELDIPDRPPGSNGNGSWPPGKEIAVYRYTDADDALLFSRHKFVKPDGKKEIYAKGADGKWGLGAKKRSGDPIRENPVKRVPYMFPLLKEAISENKDIVITEGEKDADTVFLKLGYTATCHSGGAGEWPKYMTLFFPAGTSIILCGDNDVPGEEHIRKVGSALTAQGCNVRVIKLFDEDPAPNHGLDVSDWAKDHTAADFEALVQEAREFVLESINVPAAFGPKISASTARLLTKSAPPVPDAILRARIELILSREKVSPVQLRREAAALLIPWMRENGGFVKALDTDEGYYFYEKERKLFLIESDLFAAWLYSLCGSNPASTDFRYLRADCLTQSIFSEPQKVYRFAHFDTDNCLLFVSRFDGVVYVLNGDTISEESNGDNVLFADDPQHEPFTYDIEAGAKLRPFRRLANEFPPWKDPKEAHALGFLVWVLTTFFTELCPARPIMVLLGEKGSGKSVLFRLLLRYLYGNSAELQGVPTKVDGFVATAAALHHYFIDNLDDPVKWMRDRLARLATGISDSYRRLYTSNEMGRVSYRNWMGLTSRTPDTLRRDDLVERLVILPVDRIQDDDRGLEHSFYKQASTDRSAFWGEIMVLLSAIVGAISRGELPSKTEFRMADWAALGGLIASIEGTSETWVDLMRTLKSSQSTLLLEEDPLTEALDIWLSHPENYSRALLARELYNELTTALFNLKPPTGWYKSAQAFSRQLSQVRTDLKRLYNINWRKGTDRKTHNRTVYWFED